MLYQAIEVVSCQVNANAGREGASPHPFRVQFVLHGKKKIAGTDKTVETTDLMSCASIVQVPVGKVLVEIVTGVVEGKPWQRIIAVVKPDLTVANLLQALKC